MVALRKILNPENNIINLILPEYLSNRTVEVIVLPYTIDNNPKKVASTEHLLNSKLVGLWSDREDIDNSYEYSRFLRKKVMSRINDD